MIDLEQRVADDLRRVSARRPVPQLPPSSEIISISGHRRRRRNVARSAGAVAVVAIVGAVAWFGATRSISNENVGSAVPLDAVVPVDACPVDACWRRAVVGGDGTVYAVVSSPAGTTIVTPDGDGWTNVAGDLPDGFVADAFEYARGRYWLGGSLPHPDMPDVPVPALAVSDDLSTWEVQRLPFLQPAPDGFDFSGTVNSLTFTDTLTLAMGPELQLVTWGQAPFDQDEVELDETGAAMLAQRPEWAALGTSDALTAERRNPETSDWEVVSADGSELLAVMKRGTRTFTSLAPDGMGWSGATDLDCGDDGEATAHLPGALGSTGRLIVVGDCDGTTTVWTSSDSAVTWHRSSPEELSDTPAGDLLVFAGPAGYGVGDGVALFSPDGVEWQPVVEEAGSIVGIGETSVVVALDAGGLAIVDLTAP